MPSEHTLANAANNLRIKVTALPFLWGKSEIRLRADWWLQDMLYVQTQASLWRNQWWFIYHPSLNRFLTMISVSKQVTVYCRSFSINKSNCDLVTVSILFQEPPLPSLWITRALRRRFIKVWEAILTGTREQAKTNLEAAYKFLFRIQAENKHHKSDWCFSSTAEFGLTQSHTN